MTQSLNTKSAWLPKYGFVLALIASSLFVGCMGYIYLQTQKQLIFAEKRTELSTIADLKCAQIVQWRKERLIEATSIHSNAMMSHRVHDYLNNEERDKALSEFRSWMSILHQNAGYSRVFLFKTDGELITAVSDDNMLPTEHYRQLVNAALKNNAVMLSDFHDEDHNGIIDIDLVIPIMYSTGSRTRCCAVLVLDINPNSFLYPLIQSWPTPSKSAETLLVEKKDSEVLFLNQLRFLKHAALTFRRPLSQTDLPAVRAVLGQEGIFSGYDYRGVSVLSATRSIPGTPWAMVAKIDIAEILAPMEQRRNYVVATCATFILAINLGITLWWTRKKETYLRTLFEAERKYNSDLKQAELALQEARNKLEQRVIERTKELSAANNQLKQEITERTKIEEQLYQAKRLESIGQLAGGVAHEVRNPLNAILSITEALFREKEIEDNPEFGPYIMHIRTQVTRLADLMNDLLDLGKPIPAANLQAIPLYDLCCETITLWKTSGSALNKQIVLISDEKAAHLDVHADYTKLQQVFFNLIENAAYHSPADCSVQFCIQGMDSDVSIQGMATVRIIDQGNGIAPDKIDRIFDPFFSDRKGGTGLGLALVKHFIENMGGSVQIWNNDPPPGCTAEVLIPRADKESAT